MKGIHLLRPTLPEILFGILVFAAVFNNLLWIRADESPPLWDMAGHSHRAATMGQLMETGRWENVVHFHSSYPPLNYLFTGVLFWIFGSHEDLPQISVVFYVLLLLGSVAMITIHFTQKKSLAIVAAMLTFFYPQLAHFSRIYDLDYQLVATTTFALACYLKTRQGTARNWTILFAVASAAALLTKWTSVAFILPPILIDLFLAWRREQLTQHVLKNMVLGSVIVLALAAPWYLDHWGEISAALHGARKNIFSVPTEDLWSMKNFVYYLQGTVKSIGLLSSILLLPAVIIAIWRHRDEDLFLLAWIFGAYAVMTFFLFSKESRYLLPIVPALAVMTVLSAQRFQRTIQSIGLVSVCLIALFFWYDTTWGSSWSSPAWERDSTIARWTYGYFPHSPTSIPYGVTTPSQYHTNLERIPERIRQDLIQHERAGLIFIAVVPNSVYLTAAQIQFYARLVELDHPKNAFQTDYRTSSAVRHERWRQDILRADYLITKTGEQGPSQWVGSLPEIALEEKNPASEIFRRFELLETWPLEGVESTPQEARLYRQNSNKQD
jgi:hypothetical protein